MDVEKAIKAGAWVNYGRWTQPPLSGAFWTHWHEAESAQHIVADAPATRIIFLDGYHLTSAESDRAVKEHLAHVFDAEQLKDLYERVESAGAGAEARHLALLSKSGLSDLEYARELFASYLEMVGSWGFLFRFSSSLEEITVERGLAKDDDDMLARMKPYARTTWLERQSKEIREMAALPEGAALDKRVKEHVSEFAWFGTHHWEGDGYTEEKCRADIKEARKREGEDMHTAGNAAAGEREDLWRLLASFAYWRTHAAEATAKVVFASRARLESIASAWGLDYAGLTYLTATEIVAGLEAGDAFLLPTNYAERKAGFGIIVDGSEHVFVGKELARAIELGVPKVEATGSEVKGTVASKGPIITGTARVILGPSDFMRFSEGDILIANETTPDFVPLMKKAAAIVTDTGGITSHAAIVSRELKKPCVIGTKVATKVFKDGDMVEVDAEKGIVRRLD